MSLPIEDVHVVVDPDYERVGRPWEGLSPRHAAGAAIAQFWKADIANEASLDNGVEPGGAFTSPDMLDDDQVNLIRNQLSERHSGAANRRRHLVLTGGRDWKQIAASFSEMEFSELKRMSRGDICSTFGVPGPVVNHHENSTYATAEMASQSFWTNTIIPRAEWLAEEYTNAVLARFKGDRSLSITDARHSKPTKRQRCWGGFATARRAVVGTSNAYFAWFDSSGIPAIQTAKLAQAQTAKVWADMGVPLNNVIQSLDLPFEETAWGNTWYKPIGLVDVTEEGGGYTSFADPSGAGETDLLNDPASADPMRSRGAGSIGGVAALERAVPERVRAQLWEQWRASWAALERTAHNRFRRHFNELRKQTLARLENPAPTIRSIADGGGVGGVGSIRRDLIGEVLFDLVAADDGLLKVIGPLLREGARLGGEQVMVEAADAKGLDADEADAFNVDDPNVVGKLRQRAQQIKGLNAKLRSKLNDTMAEALDNGETIEEIAERLRKGFNLAGSRARTIARTEISASVEEARAIGREQAGVPMKSWLHSRKETGRATHARTEIQTMQQPIPNDQDFVISGTSVTCAHLRGSGDPAHDINCGCTTISRYESDSIRSVIARYRDRGFLTYEQLQQRDAKRAKRQPEGAVT